MGLVKVKPLEAFPLHEITSIEGRLTQIERHLGIGSSRLWNP